MDDMVPEGVADPVVNKDPRVPRFVSKIFLCSISSPPPKKRQLAMILAHTHIDMENDVTPSLAKAMQWWDGRRRFHVNLFIKGRNPSHV